jgi:prophage antirepressor-like protein
MASIIQSFTNEEKKYLLLEDIKKSNVNKAYFIGCKTMRKVIVKHGVPDDVCLYMKSGIIYNKSYNPASLYVEEKYAEENIMNTSVLLKKKKEITELKTETRTKEKQERKAYNEDELTNEPPLIDLEEHEMFKDLDGIPMDIEVRGEKTDEGIYFKAKDIGTAFEYELIEKIILQETSVHVYGEHFKYFIGPDDSSRQMDDKKVLYLTYLGVLKLLFCAKGSDKAKRFQRWATKILFTMQMGSQADKDGLAADALDVDVSTITQIFRKSARAIPCVYLFEVGTVGNMRQHFNLDIHKDDNDKVYKYGRTEDMARRSGEHQKTYGKLKDNTFGLTVFSYVDEKFASKAETKLKHYFNNFNVNVEDDKHTELVVMNKKKLLTMKELYNDLYIHYSGNNKDLIQQMQQMQLNHQIEIKGYENKLQLERKDYELILLKKDHEMEKTIEKTNRELEKKDHEIDMLQWKHKTELQENELKYLRQLLK